MSKAVLITGATGKLGRKIVEGFSALGYTIVFSGRNSNTAKDLTNKAIELGAKRAEWIEVDLEMEGFTSLICERLNFLDISPNIVVNNARSLDYLKLPENGIATRRNWQGEFLLGVIVPYELTTSLLYEPDSKLESVINIASIYGITAPNLHLYENPVRDSPINYGVVKAALIQLTSEMAVRFAKNNIRVNSISYGGVEGRVDSAFKERYKKLCPSGRMLNESEIFGAVQFLASDLSSGMTGHNLVVDGGWTVW